MLLDRTYLRDRLGKTQTWVYDGARRVVRHYDQLNRQTGYAYCDCGSPEYVTNAVGTAVQAVTHYVYDYQGRLTERYLPDGTSSTNLYDKLGRLLAVRDALGGVTNAYDNLGRLTAVTNAAGQLQKILYDVKDRPTNTVDALGVTVVSTYDDLGRLRTRTYPDTGIESYGYTANIAGPTSYTNQVTNIVTYAYDAAGRKTKEVYVGVSTNSFGYNPFGDLLSLTNGKSYAVRWNYDLEGRVTNKVDQASAEILRYKYDAGGRLTNRWSAAKGNTYYAYDAVGNLTNVDYPAGTTDLRYQYDARNRVTNMVDAVGTTKYTYTASSQLRIEDGPWASDNVTNSYHASVPGLRTGVSVQQPTGTWAVTETPDAAKRLASVTSPAGTFTYTYKGPSLVWVNLALPNVAAITNSLDNVGRLTGTYLKTNATVVLSKYLYQYNKAGQRWLMTRTDGNSVTNTFDSAGQLARAMGSGGESTENLGYGYDPAWNLNKRTNVATVTTFTVDAKDQLTAVGATSYTYDSNGNLTGEGTTKVFTYDAENQLVSVYTTGGYMYRHDFVYDGRGRMRKRVDYTYTTNWVVSGETRYVYDGMRVIQERNSANVPTVSYTRGNDLSGSLEGAGGIGGLLARSDQYSSGSMTRHACYFADGNGNVVNLVDASSAHTVWATYRYNPYGVSTYSNGTLASANVYRFSSKAYLDNPGLYYYGYRWYEPNLQRWLNRDPIGELGGLNLYHFNFNDPIGRVDTDGLGSITSPAAIQIQLELEADELGITVAELLERKAAQKAAETMAKQLAKDGANSVLKACRSFGKRIEEHLAKIAKDPKSRDVDHWKKEIDNWKRLKQAGEDLLKRAVPPKPPVPPVPPTPPPVK